MHAAENGMKKCSKCGAVKPVSEFYAKQGVCKICHKLASHERYIAHREEHLSKCKEYKEKTRDHILDIGKIYRENNRESINYKRRGRYTENRIVYNKCVKNPSCSRVGGKGAEFVILTCPICGKEFRKQKSAVDYEYQRSGQTQFYCSRECYWESLRKTHKSEYEKKITKLLKDNK